MSLEITPGRFFVRRSLAISVRSAASVSECVRLNPPNSARFNKLLLRAAKNAAHYAVMSSCLCKYGEGAGFPFQVESLEDGVDDAVHALDIHKARHWPGAARTSTKQRSITLVVLSLRHRWRGKAKNDSSSGRSSSSRQPADVVTPPAYQSCGTRLRRQARLSAK